MTSSIDLATPVSLGTKTRGSGRSRLLSGRGWSLFFAIATIGLLAFGLARLYEGWKLTEANRMIASGETRPDAPPQVVFAHAVALERGQKYDEALAAYAEAEALGDVALRHAVGVNVSNLYLRRGIATALTEGSPQRAMALVQLAKTGYRRALRDQPDDWNTRYNLELAMHVLPDIKMRNWRQSGNEPESEDQKENKAAWTEMLGHARGMH